jgi:hypothetical protein
LIDSYHIFSSVVLLRASKERLGEEEA